MGPLCRPKRDGGIRLILNIKELNKNVKYHAAFQEGGSSNSQKPFETGDWMTKQDLKEAYTCVPILESRRRFLQIPQWSKSVPISQSPCWPRIVAKIMKLITVLMRRIGLRLVIYFGRHFDNETKQRRCDKRSKHSGLGTTQFGVDPELDKIGNRTFTNN